jgi:hypothetical protein
MNDREKMQICVSACQAICGVDETFVMSLENPPRIRYEGRTMGLDSFLDTNWIAWAMRFAPNQTADALTAMAADENLDFDSMSEREIQFEWLCGMNEIFN